MSSFHDLGHFSYDATAKHILSTLEFDISLSNIRDHIGRYYAIIWSRNDTNFWYIVIQVKLICSPCYTLSHLNIRTFWALSSSFLRRNSLGILNAELEEWLHWFSYIKSYDNPSSKSSKIPGNPWRLTLRAFERRHIKTTIPYGFKNQLTWEGKKRKRKKKSTNNPTG